MPGRVAKRIAGGREPGISETLLVHFYRAEVARSTRWRERLDTTTNWSITTTAAVLSFAFSNPESPPVIVLVGAFAVFVFLAIEARRYRYYDIWARRVRLIEFGYLLPLARKEPVRVDFFSSMAVELNKPRLRISTVAALAFRLRRTYAWILGGLLVAWWVKLDIHPQPAEGFAQILERAHIGFVPGSVVMAFWFFSVLFFFWLLFVGIQAPLPSTELRAPTRKRRVPLGDIFRGESPGGSFIP